MKRLISVLLLTAVLALALTSCAPAQPAVSPSPSEPSPSPSAGASPDTGELLPSPEEPEQGREPGSAISAELLEWFNDGFFNGDEWNIHNQFLTCLYEAPEDVDIVSVFYNGPEGESAQLTDEEKEALLAKYGEDTPLDLDFSRFTIDEADTALMANIGLKLEQTNKTGLDDTWYLEDYDAYYHMHGDTNYVFVQVLTGTWNSDGTLILRCSVGEQGLTVGLREIDSETYLFVSCISSDVAVG